MILEDLEKLGKRMEGLEETLDPAVKGRRIREVKQLVKILNEIPHKRVFSKSYTGGFSYLLELSEQREFLIFFVPEIEKFDIEGVSPTKGEMQLGIDELVDFLSMIPSNEGTGKKKDDYENFMKYCIAFLEQRISTEEEKSKYASPWKRILRQF